MNRRTFLASSTTTVGALSLAAGKKKKKKSKPRKVFDKVPLRMSVPLGFFRGTLEEKFKSVAAWGFPAYEWLGPKGDLAEVRKAADGQGLKLSCMGGVGAIAEGGMVNPADHDRLVEDFKRNIERAKILGTRNLIGLTGNVRMDVSVEEQTGYVIDCVKRLAPIAEANDVTIVMEALNPLVDHKGFFLTRTDQTMAILNAVGSPNVKMLFDIYHQQITEGNVIRNFRSNIDQIGHFHVADNPGRHEPGTGEMNYTNIFKAIARTDYEDFVALEFSPSRRSGLDAALNAVAACFDWS